MVFKEDNSSKGYTTEMEDLILYFGTQDIINLDQVLEMICIYNNKSYTISDLYFYLKDQGIIAEKDGEYISCAGNKGYLVFQDCNCKNEIIVTHKGLLWLIKNFECKYSHGPQKTTIDFFNRP